MIGLLGASQRANSLDVLSLCAAVNPDVVTEWNPFYATGTPEPCVTDWEFGHDQERNLGRCPEMQKRG
jgi:hypothetical protein